MVITHETLRFLFNKTLELITIHRWIVKKRETKKFKRFALEQKGKRPITLLPAAGWPLRRCTVYVGPKGIFWFLRFMTKRGMKQVSY